MDGLMYRCRMFLRSCLERYLFHSLRDSILKLSKKFGYILSTRLDSLKSSLFPRLNQNLLQQSLVALFRLILDWKIWLLALTSIGHPLLWMVVNLNLLTSGSQKKRPDCNLSKIDKRLSGSIETIKLGTISTKR